MYKRFTFSVWILLMSTTLITANHNDLFIGDVTVEIESTNPTCSNYNNGTATANADGGWGPYTYKWSNGRTTRSISGLSAGTYSVTVTDMDLAIASATVTLTAPDPLIVEVIAQGDACQGTEVDYEAVATGGTAPYTYNWSDGSTQNVLSTDTPGDYFVTVTDANGCNKVAYAKVNPAFSVKVITEDVRCNEFCDAGIRAMTTGGKAPFTFAWSNGQTGQILEALPAGIYTVTVTDADGCEATATGEVMQPAPIISNLQISGSCDVGTTASASVNPTGGVGNYTILWSTGETSNSISNLQVGREYTVMITDGNGCKITERFTVPSDGGLVIEAEKTDITCNNTNNGTATVTVMGGTAPFNYNWSNGASVAMIENLAAGTYTVTVTDASGCEGVTSITIEDTGELTLELSSTPPDCEDSDDGMANVVASGGTAPYRYLWSDGQTTGTAMNLAPGDYTVTVTDLLGCEGVGMVTVEDGPIIEVNIDTDTTSNSLTAIVNGGTAPYSYMWDNGDTTATTTGYEPGDTYTLKVTDARGCMKTITGTIPNNPNLIVTVQTTPTCEGESDGTATININGGTPPYVINWGNDNETTLNPNLAGGTYTVVVTDADGNTQTITYDIEEIVLTIEVSTTPQACGSTTGGSASVSIEGGDEPYTIIWSNGATAANLDALAIGTYEVTVTDTNGCTKEETIEITADENLSASITTTATLCGAENGTATAVANSGTAPYTYLWNNGATTATIEDLGTGSYTVTITDANGCEGEATTIIEEDNDIAVTSSSVNANCVAAANGSVSIDNITGGTAPYTILWSTGDVTMTVDDLAPGTYTVTVTDANDCERTAEATVGEDNDIEVMIDVEINGNGELGSLTAVATGGSGNYTYAWCTDENSATISDLIVGGYTVTVTDELGCENTGIAYINVPPVVNIEPNCDGTANVSIITGGCVALDIDWGNGATGESTIIENGDHTVTINLPNGEIISTDFNVDAPLLEVEAEASSEALCLDSNDGSATAIGSGGTAPYTYEWSNEQETATITDLAPGTYTVTITDANDCTATASVTIEEKQIDATAIGATICEGEMANPSVINNDPNTELTYSWTPIELFEDGTANLAEPTFIGTESVTVNVVITSADGCTREESVQITVSERSRPDVSQISFEESCRGLEVDFNGNGQTEGYIWRFGDPNNSNDISDQSNPTYTYSGTGTFTVTLIPADAAACQDTANFQVTIEGEEELAFDISGDPMACGQDVNTFSVDDTELQVKWFAANDLENPLSEFNSTDLGVGEYVVEVENEEGCTGTQTLTVMDISVQIDLQEAYTICAGEEFPIEIVNLNEADILEYVWEPNDIELIDTSDPSNPIFRVDQTTTFTTTASNQFGCSITKEVTINVEQAPVVGDLIASKDTINLGESVDLEILDAEGDYTYEFSDGSSDPNQTVSPQQTTTYTVVITPNPENSCPPVTRSVTVVVLNNPCDEPFIFIPNAFTPNGDGNNDVIRVRGAHIEEMELMIYNRWGELVFETDSQEEAWNGIHRRTGDLAEGRVFGYYLTVRCIGGETFTKKGNITLIR